MIRKAQTKFILIIMSLMLGVFLLLFGVSYFSLQNLNDRNIKNTLDRIETHYVANGELTIPNSLVIVLTRDESNQFSNKSILTNTTTITERQIQMVIDNASGNSFNSGSVENVYYKVYFDGNRFIISATDANEFLHVFKSNVSNFLILLIIIYLLLFIFVYILSLSVFDPIKETFFKQKQFISNASHELKTPLTIISANAEVLKQNGENQWIDNISSQTERLNILVNDMLSLAKIDEAKEQLSILNFNLSEVVTNEALAFDALAFEKGKTLNLFIQPNLQYKGDIKSVKNIVNILLDNAVKHANTGGEITLQLKKESSKITLTVFNTGSNIPNADSQKIFERFYRSDQSRSRESGGSGLGLSIAKGIADNNKWKITASSKYQESMTITIIL
ncbi:MAG: hypothetical protein E7348_00050 [Clostridiales bacterium]|nr:hypothetical protein [Clostridiales bacterium]